MNGLSSQVIVTGAASGIGAAVVRILVERGVSVGALDIDAAGLDTLWSSTDLVRAKPADVCDAGAVAEAISAVSRDRMPISGLVNCAGGGGGQTIREMTADQWRATLDLNLTSAFLVTKAVLERMIDTGGGAIVNVASVAAYRPSPIGGAAYSAAKAGMLAFTRQCAHELAVHRIRANAVCPGPTRTALTRNPDSDRSRFPLGRWIEPEDVARSIVHLLGEDSAMCSGTAITIDGGVTL